MAHCHYIFQEVARCRLSRLPIQCDVVWLLKEDGVVGIERGGHQFTGLVSAFTDLTSILRREYAMNGEIQEPWQSPSTT